METKPRGAQVTLQQVDGLADVVAGRQEDPTERVARADDAQPTDEFPHDDGRTPGMHGEAEPDALAFKYTVFVDTRPDGADVAQCIAGGLGHLAGGPTGVTRARKIEYHVAKLP